MPELAIQRACELRDWPGDAFLRMVATAALEGLEEPVLNIRIVDEPEGRFLNARWRDRDRATNVLSFPAELPEGTGLNLLGDVVVCAPVVEREAREQGKRLSDHLAHLLIHGILHLRGHDHTSPDDAEVMEAREVALLAGFGISDPYDAREHHSSDAPPTPTADPAGRHPPE